MKKKNGLFESFFTHGERITVDKNQIIYAPDNDMQTNSLYFLESGLVDLMSYSRRRTGLSLYERATDYLLYVTAP